MRAVSAVALVLAGFALGCGPVPGGKLSGTEVPVPADWSETLSGGRGLCEVESRPSDPHSIQVECFVDERALHAQSHRWALASWWPVESWAAVWLEHPDVLVRIDGLIFLMRAVPVEDEAVRARILGQRGYDEPPEGIVVFRFDPR
jgi:hypothetical protein